MMKKEKETRIMKVTMEKRNFELFDQGVTHSNKGLRNNAGQLSALPDIENVTEEDLPCRVESRTQKVYVQPESPVFSMLFKDKLKDKLIDKAAEYTADKLIEYFKDPQTIALSLQKARSIFQYHFTPLFQRDSISQLGQPTKAQQLLAADQRAICPPENAKR